MFKNIWRVLFYIYILMILNFIVIKFTGNINNVINTIQDNIYNRNNGGIAFNLIPFRTIKSYITNMSFSVSFFNILGNIIPFIPLGFLIPMAFSSSRSFIKTMIFSFFLICSVELLQITTYLGRFDIDDIMLNLFSCFIGFILFMVFRKFLI